MSKETREKKEAMVRELLGRVADKWTLLAIEELREHPLRFSELGRRLGNVSQKMLTKTLRQLERDGLVTRTVHATVPPSVEYALTSAGASLGESICSLWVWVEKHLEGVERARQRFDARKRPTPPAV